MTAGRRALQPRRNVARQGDEPHRGALGLRDRMAKFLGACGSLVFHQHDDVVAGARLRDGEIDAIALAAVEAAGQDGVKDSQSNVP